MRQLSRRSTPRRPADGWAVPSGWWLVNLVVFAFAQLLDVLTTGYALDRGLSEGSPLSRLLMPAGDVLPWVVVKLLSIVLVAAVAAFVVGHDFPKRIQVTISLIIVGLSVITLITAAQNLVLVVAG